MWPSRTELSKFTIFQSAMLLVNRVAKLPKEAQRHGFLGPTRGAWPDLGATKRHLVTNINLSIGRRPLDGDWVTVVAPPS